MLIHDQQSINNAVVHENRFSLCCESQLSWFSFGQIYGTKLYMSYPHIVIIIVFLFKSQPVLVPSMVTVNVSCTAGSHDRNLIFSPQPRDQSSFTNFLYLFSKHSSFVSVILFTTFRSFDSKFLSGFVYPSLSSFLSTPPFILSFSSLHRIIYILY